jgi:hypothetical protein
MIKGLEVSSSFDISKLDSKFVVVETLRLSFSLAKIFKGKNAINNRGKNDFKSVLIFIL